jgi:hypothetical protein
MAYAKVLHVHNGGSVVSLGCGVEFVDMTSKVLFFPLSPSFSEVALKIKVALGWNDIGDEIVLEGRYDASGSSSFNRMITINGSDEWDVYKELVDSSKIKSLVVVAVKVTGRGNLLIDLNKHPFVRCNDVRSEDVYDAGPSQPPPWESEIRHDEDILD